MNRAKEMATLCSKANRGPGGWKCPCCRFRGPKSWTKSHLNRVFRRAVRIAVRKEAREMR